jgi:hypothetical protein
MRVQNPPLAPIKNPVEAAHCATSTWRWRWYLYNAGLNTDAQKCRESELKQILCMLGLIRIQNFPNKARSHE